MTDFEKIKNALFEGGFREDKDFGCSEWENRKDFFLETEDMNREINFEFDSKGNLMAIS